MRTVRTLLLALTTVLCGHACAGQDRPQAQPAHRPASIGAPRLVAISVAELGASIAWYRDNLGFVERSQKNYPSNGVKIALLESNGFWLEMFEKKKNFPPEFVKQHLPGVSDLDEVTGLKKLAFTVTDLDAVITTLRNNNVRFQTKIMESDDPAFGRSVIVLDNNGNWIQFCESHK